MMYTHTLKRKGRYLNAEGNSKGKRRKEIVSSRARTRVEREKKKRDTERNRMKGRAVDLSSFDSVACC